MIDYSIVFFVVVVGGVIIRELEMSLNLTCLKQSRTVRLFSNRTSTYFHSISRNDDEDFLFKFSSFITNSTFSSIDLQIVLKDLLNNQWKFPTKLISSMIIYSSLSILIFLTCSVLFYIISSSKLTRFKSSKYRLKTITILFLIVFYVIFLIKMVFLIQNLNQTKVSFEQSIEEIDSKILSKHLKSLLINFDNFSSNSIVVDQTKIFIIKTFEKLFGQIYSLNEINSNLKNIHEYFNEILQTEFLKNSFHEFVISYREMVEDLTNLNQKVCLFIDENHLKIENEIFSLLKLIRKQFEHFIRMIDEEFIGKINWSIIDRTKQEQIRSFISILTTLIIITITFITIIPIAFFLIIIINYFYHLYYQ